MCSSKQSSQFRHLRAAWIIVVALLRYVQNFKICLSHYGVFPCWTALFLFREDKMQFQKFQLFPHVFDLSFVLRLQWSQIVAQISSRTRIHPYNRTIERSDEMWLIRACKLSRQGWSWLLKYPHFLGSQTRPQVRAVHYLFPIFILVKSLYNVDVFAAFTRASRLLVIQFSTHLGYFLELFPSIIKTYDSFSCTMLRTNLLTCDTIAGLTVPSVEPFY